MEPQDFRAWRKSHHLTQKQLGERLGVSYRTIQDWEAGLREGVHLKMVDLALEALAARESDRKT